MLNDVSWPKDHSYRSGSENLPFQFYLDSLKNSDGFDLLLGYFSSSAIHILSIGFAKFISSGGVLRMIINDVLSSPDKQAIINGQAGLVVDDLIDLSNFEELRNSLDVYGQHFFECIAFLIAHDRIQIKVIRPKTGSGIAHYKSGIFKDGFNKVGFKASCNFTSFGLLANLEEIETYMSWEDGRSRTFLDKQSSYFEEIFSGNADFVEYLPANQITAHIRKQFNAHDINELLIKEDELLDLKTKHLKDLGLEANGVEVPVLEDNPRFPYKEGPRDYQQTAYNNWISNNYQGLFAMATGTGKTITSLNCVVEEFKKNGFYHFIVLVPTIALANQWHSEVTDKFNFGEALLCSSKHLGWESRFNQYGRNFLLGLPNNFCLIVTYATFRGKRFQQSWNRNFGRHLSKMTLIADEAHTLGSDQLLKVLPFAIIKRIGLSATPERVYDQKGQDQLCQFFNSYGPNYTFVYNMQQAINDGILCKYYYHPIMVDLEPDELEQYRHFTKQLVRYIDPATGRYRDNPIVNNLLIQRKSVIHKARQKETTLQEIIEGIGPKNFKYAFIYVPEGNQATYDEQDETVSDEEDVRIVDTYTRLLYQAYRFKMRKFLGDTPDRESILEQFKNGHIDAILAMKCLDEGVDVPRTQYAIFCSSTGNPRQYVQRRGRVLRYHKDKSFAYIYDMVVKPPIDITHGRTAEYRLEKNILMGELKCNPPLVRTGVL